MPAFYLPKKCPHHNLWDECCLAELLEKNPGVKAEDVIFSEQFFWVKIAGTNPT